MLRCCVYKSVCVSSVCVTALKDAFTAHSRRIVCIFLCACWLSSATNIEHSPYNYECDTKVTFGASFVARCCCVTCSIFPSVFVLACYLVLEESISMPNTHCFLVSPSWPLIDALVFLAGACASCSFSNSIVCFA